MIFLVMPALGLSLLPIIVIEAVYLGRRLELSTADAVKTSTIANLVSTLVGIPLTWFLLVLVQMFAGGGGAYGINTTAGKILAVTLQAAWLIPYESDMSWMIPVAGLVLLIPFFFASWWSEYLVSRKILHKLPAQTLKREVRNANILTYALLACWPIGFWLLNH
jgi:glycopeptide antibiotics resistance protein